MREQMAFPGLESPSELLSEHHYLGDLTRGVAYSDADGVIVFANPTSRRLPVTWLEVSRWCILRDRGKNAGSSQWSRAWRWAASRWPDATTVVSYSDPGVGHTGALYRACNWLWAPTWHRLRPPPSGNGTRSGKKQGTKDRWVFLLRPDHQRQEVLRLRDKALEKRMPWAEYREPTWTRRGRPRQDGGGEFGRWHSENVRSAFVARQLLTGSP